VATWVALEKHPHIVRCYRMDILDNQPFMLLEWIAGDTTRGTDLRSWLQHGGLHLRQALDVTIDICRGLLHAQKKQPGIVHRDLKPENILIAQGKIAIVKITDFGLAKIAQDTRLSISRPVEKGKRDHRHYLTSHEGIVGTPAYMAPEQWNGEPLDPRADIYALGCMLYEMFTGNLPFQATTLEEWRRQHVEAAIPQVKESQHIPASVNLLLAHCLAKNPDNRFPDVKNLLQELTQIYQQQFSHSPKILFMDQALSVSDLVNRGITYGNLERYDDALADFNRAIELDPSSAMAYVNRGYAYAQLQRYDEALKDYTYAIQLDPTEAIFYFNRGKSYDKLRRYKKSIQDYSEAIRLDPSNPNFYRDRGYAYSRLQRYQESLADYTHAIQITPDDAELYYNRGILYAAYLKQPEQALADFTSAIKLNLAHVSAYTDRGSVYCELQQYEKALSDYERAIELDPSFGRAYYSIGALLANRGAFQEALPYLEKSAQLGFPQGVQYLNLVREKAERQHEQQEIDL
jgi:serine/threonine protein kinase